MGIKYENLDNRTREFMIKELELDISNGKLYISTRLNPVGKANWGSILREAIQNYNDDWLAGELLNRGYMRTQEEKRTPSGGTTMHACNFVRPHMALDGKIPSEMCGLKVEGENKWITLIQNASKAKD